MEGAQILLSDGPKPQYAIKIHPEFWTSAAVASVPVEGRVTWLMLLTMYGTWNPISHDVDVALELMQYDVGLIVGSGRDLRIPAQPFASAYLPAELERSALTPKMKQTIKARDRDECRICGDTENLHVDHIWPIARGGRSEAVNMWTLCGPCNLWKAAKEPGDWLTEVWDSGRVEYYGPRWQAAVDAVGAAYTRARELELVG